ncbi:MAG: hypothetical protein IPM14_07710 [bacterium]|nr:hypothetical protein [bacterium]
MQQQELFIDIDDKSSDNTISERIGDLISSGYKSVKLGIRSTFQKKENEIELDLIQFKKIKEIQDLPDWVIIKLILAAGSLRESSFKDRFLND